MSTQMRCLLRNTKNINLDITHIWSYEGMVRVGDWEVSVD